MLQEHVKVFQCMRLFSDFAVDDSDPEQPCVARLFIFALRRYAWTFYAKKFGFQLYQFNVTENCVNIKAFSWAVYNKGSPEGSL